MMDNINVKAVRSDEIYRKMMKAPIEKRDDIYRYDFMKQFEKKWEIYHCPLKAKQEGGYDVVMASGMLGYILPQAIDETCEEYITLLSRESLWEESQKSIVDSFHCFIEAGIELPVKNYLYTLTLADPESPYMKTSDNYCGDGGIPGYIFGALVPSENTLSRIPAALAHEANHNVRFQFIQWKNNISLGEYLICEGLAENFAEFMFGREKIGPWVTKTSQDELNEYIKPLIQDALEVRGFDQISSYMYGDELAKMQNYVPVGLPYCAGYACGYHLIKYYLEHTGRSIIEATILPGNDILKEVQGFWTTATEF